MSGGQNLLALLVQRIRRVRHVAPQLPGRQNLLDLLPDPARHSNSLKFQSQFLVTPAAACAAAVRSYKCLACKAGPAEAGVTLDMGLCVNMPDSLRSNLPHALGHRLAMVCSSTDWHIGAATTRRHSWVARLIDHSCCAAAAKQLTPPPAAGHSSYSRGD